MIYKMFLTIACVFSVVVGFTEDTIYSSKQYHDTLFSGISSYIYYQDYSSQFETVKSPNYSKIYEIHDRDALMPRTLEYSSLNTFTGNDTIVVVEKTYDSSVLIDTITFILTSVSFSPRENKVCPVFHISEICEPNLRAKEYDTHTISSDSIFFSGSVKIDCCSMKMMSVKYSGDTVYVIKDFIEGGCTCLCGYDYNFSLPRLGNEKFISYEGYTTAVSIDEPLKSPSVFLTQNVVSNELIIMPGVDFDEVIIYTMNGQMIKLLNIALVDVSDITNGTYLIQLVKGSESIGTEVFVKH